MTCQAQLRLSCQSIFAPEIAPSEAVPDEVGKIESGFCHAGVCKHNGVTPIKETDTCDRCDA